MSKPRNIWWAYVRAMVRVYPEREKQLAALRAPSVTQNYSGMPGSGVISDPTASSAMRCLPETEQKEHDAVEAAIRITRNFQDGEDRIKLIGLVFWKNRYRLSDAADKLFISYSTAKRWQQSFLRIVAGEYGLLQKEVTRDKNERASKGVQKENADPPGGKAEGYRR